MSFDDAILLSIPVMFFGAWGAERLIGGGRSFPEIKFWWLLGTLGFIVSGAASAVLPAIIAPALTPLHLFNLSSWGLWAALPVIVLTTYLTYWSHRIQHRFDILWRLGHQLHHGAARVDIGSAMMFHPIDLMVQFTMATLAATLLGVTAQAAGLAGAIGFFIAVFQHWNIRTPRWIGYIIQRPEAHCLHHERDVHARNFGDMPIWDILFGTFENPETVDVRVGFEPERGRRVLSMIACVDVNQTQGRAKL